MHNTIKSQTTINHLNLSIKNSNNEQLPLPKHQTITKQQSFIQI